MKKRFSIRVPRVTLGAPRLLRWASARLMRLAGWQVEGSVPDVPKYVAIGAYHTSNWDFVVMLGAALHFRLRAFWVGKHTLFRWPFGRLFRWLGGIPVQRGASYNVVDQVVDFIHAHSAVLVVVAPEGTRSAGDHWKTGFYWIAREAGVPILMGYINYERRVIGLGPLLYPSDDIEADFARLHEFYTTHARGRFPAREMPPVLRQSPQDPDHHTG